MFRRKERKMIGEREEVVKCEETEREEIRNGNERGK